MRTIDRQKAGLELAVAPESRPLDRARVDFHPARAPFGHCPELDCVRGRLSPAVLAAAEQRALALNVSAESVLIGTRAISEDAYVVALAAWLRVAFEPLETIAREDCPLPDEQLADTDARGLLPLWIGGEVVGVIAPLRASARKVIALARSHPDALHRIR